MKVEQGPVMGNGPATFTGRCDVAIAPAGSFLAGRHGGDTNAGVQIFDQDPGVKRGIRIGGARDGSPPVALAAGVSADPKGGVVYAEGVRSMALHKFVRQ